MIATPAVRNLIRQQQTHQIPGTIQVSRKYGMQLLDDAIMVLLKKGWISPEEAFPKANDKEKFKPLLPPTAKPADFTEV